MTVMKHGSLRAFLKGWKWGKLLLVVFVLSAPMLGVGDHAGITVDSQASVAAHQECTVTRVS